MKYLIGFLCVFSLFIACKTTATGDSKKEYTQLFNGENLDGWVVKIKGYPVGENVKNTFRVVDGILEVRYDEYDTFEDSFGHLFYKTPYSNYRFKMQYRFVGEQLKGGPAWAQRNSGVMVHAQSPESMQLNQDFPVSVEVQLLGGIEEGKPRPTGNMCSPGTHVIMDDSLVTDHCVNSTSKTYYGEQWVDLEILVVQDSIISHKINGVEVMKSSQAQIGGQFNTLESRAGEILKSGYIALQSESHPVDFKNIELLVLE